MQTMFWPATIAMLGGALFLGAAGIFLLALQYRRHGRLSWRRTITTAAAAVYCFGLFSYTMLPLPSSRSTACVPGRGLPQLNPGHFVNDFQLTIAEQGMRGFATSFTLWQVIFNVILFMPLGLLAVRWLRGNIFTAIVLGFAASLSIELTQYTGIWGLYDCAYRVADVDDIIVNTAGTLAGAVFAYLPVFSFLTGPREGDARFAAPRRVSRARRVLANVFDLAITTGAVFVISGARSLVEKLGGPVTNEKLMNLWIPVVVVFFVFLLPNLTPGRASLGQRCAWLMVTGENGGPAPAWRAVLRSVLGFGGVTFLFQISTSITDLSPYPVLNMVLTAYMVISTVFFLADSQLRGLAAMVSGTGFIDRRAIRPPAQ
ncbi:VanZ family protein [Glutamicibacter sp. M10]|uniref:VanZ family protein n=1 Tax=Glutamicibacter sp. M10 TaxID=3023076 RepID=UPI0021C649DF|nr:VanZ family protein [Glutamicibacter sp. M10]UXN31162.1 VanZ family protein [Glutamicibacter sp. M10]